MIYQLKQDGHEVRILGDNPETLSAVLTGLLVYGAVVVRKLEEDNSWEDDVELLGEVPFLPEVDWERSGLGSLKELGPETRERQRIDNMFGAKPYRARPDRSFSGIDIQKGTS